MFGYILPNEYPMTQQQKDRYHAYYCGVCHSLGKNHSGFCRSTLSFDMTFLALFLDGFYLLPDMTDDQERCFIRPRKKHVFYKGQFIDYAADMNLALTYHKLLDDWIDEHNIIRKGEARLFKKTYLSIADRYPRQCNAIETGLKQISIMEKHHETNPDHPTKTFGKILGELFVYDPADENASGYRQFGEALGRLIYIYDAVMDLRGDLKKKRYNPLTAMANLNGHDLLSMFLNDCIIAFEELPDNQNKDIIENVLYSGVWSAYAGNKKVNHDL